MNKSLGTNLASLGLIGLSFLSPIYQTEIKTMGLYSLSGALTNWLAIHMLFEKVPFLYGSGIVTERFEEFKLGIRNLMMNQFFSKDKLKEFMENFASGENVLSPEKIIEEINFDEVFLKLKTAIMESSFGGMIGMFGGPEALDPLKPNFESKFKEIITDLFNNDNFMARVSGASNQNSAFEQKVVTVVDGRLNELTPKMVKEIIQEMIAKHLGWLVVWGTQS